MRLPTATLLTACALSAALVVAGRGGEAANHTMPGSDVVLPAAEGHALFDDVTGGSAPDADADADADAGTDADGSDLDRGLDPGAFDPDAIGPETVPELPDPLDGGGLIPDGPDESDAIFGSPVDVALG
ncbi:hypothetical protein QFZ56_006838 [Streptomyces achromogenes]|uniref:Uncharacterized protein n=1 Tax=Streptomyces achromogenes TaxID=67255 RepID=A0ABU0QB51_STRAH|nr:hypothetical protein [Streptomyces achromogenes]MDQ0687875.1 hypothetical protein [Streptomyces achromogenes]